MTLSTLTHDLPAINPFGDGTPHLAPMRTVQKSDQFERMGKWLELFMATAEVAKVLARTAFVPEPMRGEPEAVAAAMMKALELGIDPLDGLSSMHVVKGKVGYSAEFMRRRIIEAGHEIEFDETTDDRCKMRGRRAGQDKWQTVTFTADQARKAKIDLGSYPADKLVARASSRMCRRVFPDVLAGAAIIEDILDGEVVEGTYEPGAQGDPVRTLQRKPRQPRKSAEPAPVVAQPPASDLDQFEPPAAQPAEIASASSPEQVELPGQADGDDATPDDPATGPQNRKMHALFREAGVEDRDDRLTVTGHIIGYPITSSSGLTKTEAIKLIDTLEGWSAGGRTEDEVREILNAATLAAEGIES